MSVFLIYLIIIGILSYLVVGTLIFFNTDNTPIVKRVCMIIIIPLLIAVSLAGLCTLDEKGNEQEWNDGQCPSCNVAWDFEGAAKSRNGWTTYYYECPQCHDIIEQ